jgi:putative hydrolase of HD superfamily
LVPDSTAVYFLALWKEFENGESLDVLFARSIDRSMPVLLNLVNHGGSWLEDGITFERVAARIGYG